MAINHCFKMHYENRTKETTNEHNSASYITRLRGYIGMQGTYVQGSTRRLYNTDTMRLPYNTIIIMSIIGRGSVQTKTK